MTPTRLRTLALAYCLLAGAMDTVTGFLLVAAPAWTLRLMWIPVLPAEPVYMRFVGAFVAGVGLCYVAPFLLGPAARDARLPVVLEATALVRLCVGLFTGAAILSGALHPAWITVAASDPLLAVVQVLWIRPLLRPDAR